MDAQVKTVALASLTVAVSGAAYFFGTGLNPHWWLTWIAPLPVLMFAPRIPRWHAASMAFGAFVVQGLNMFAYYRLVVPLAVSLIVLLVPALLFAAVVLVFRSFVLRGMLLRAAFVVPALWVAIEYLSEFRSPHGTFGNIAYSQMDFLPPIQIAALTGIWGISFLLFLFPAAIAANTAPSGAAQQKRVVALSTCILFVAVLTYGLARLHAKQHTPTVAVALLDTDAQDTMYLQGPATVALIRAYAAHIPDQAKQGAQVVVFPEKLGRFTDAEVKQSDEILGSPRRKII